MIAISASVQPSDWIKAEPYQQWLSGGAYWVTIRRGEDGATGIGLMAGTPSNPLAIVRDFDVSDGRDYVVTHFCPCLLNWPKPAEQDNAS